MHPAPAAVGKNTKSAAEKMYRQKLQHIFSEFIGRIGVINKKRKHRAIICYSMFSGGEKKLFITSFVIGNDIIAL
jgi:hypothetical protein